MRILTGMAEMIRSMTLHLTSTLHLHSRLNTQKVRLQRSSDVLRLVDTEQESKAMAALKKAGISAPPVNPIKVAKAHGIPVYWNRFSDRRIHGSVSVDRGSIRIDVEERDAENRRRFTIAHELGHAFNHMKSDGFSQLSDGKAAGHYRTDFVEGDHPVSEIVANDFGGSLLMPEEWIREYWEQLHSVEKMAKEFRVSKDAMMVRLRKLGISF